MQNTQNQASRFMGNQGNAQAQTTVGQLVLWAALSLSLSLLYMTLLFFSVLYHLVPC